MQKLQLEDFDFEFKQWNEIPEWVQWVAQNFHGQWWGFEIEPYTDGHLCVWDIDPNKMRKKILISKHGSENAPNWKFTLNKRPETIPENVETHIVKWVLAHVDSIEKSLFDPEQYSVLYRDPFGHLTKNKEEAEVWSNFDNALDFISDSSNWGDYTIEPLMSLK